MRRPAHATALVVLVALAGCRAQTPSTAPTSAAAPATRVSAVTTPSPSSPPVTASTRPTSPTAVRTAARTTPPLHDAAAATRKIRALTALLGKGGVSIEAYRPDTRARFRVGATGGMACGSIAKLFILETLLLQHQSTHTALTQEERDLAEAMITESDNAAADALYEQIGEGPALDAVAARLGVRHTVPGNGIYWGFTTTSAADYVALVAALTHNGPLTKASRAYTLALLRDVDDGQHWGISAAADHPSRALLKDGWLASSRDDFRWLVNSVGMIVVDGHRVLITVLTQHNSSFDGGIDLVEKLATIAASVVA